MNTCKTCAHWTKPSREPVSSKSYIECDLCYPRDQDTYEEMPRQFEVGICKQPTQGFCESPVERNGFSLADASTYMAILATAEDFGCVRHEPLPTPPKD